MPNRVFLYHLRGTPQVRDGDTIKVVLDRGERDYSERNVRLIGLDTPEVRTKDRREKACGLKVSGIVQWWLVRHPDCQFRACVWQEQEKYGRFLGDFVDGDQSLCRFLLDNKLARPYKGESRKRWTAEQLSLIEAFRTEATNAKAP